VLKLRFFMRKTSGKTLAFAASKALLCFSRPSRNLAKIASLRAYCQEPRHADQSLPDLQRQLP
jgi:hypothetical protein